MIDNIFEYIHVWFISSKQNMDAVGLNTLEWIRIFDPTWDSDELIWSGNQFCEIEMFRSSEPPATMSK